MSATLRYPFAPLAAAMGMSENGAARALGLSGSSYKQYRSAGVSELVGDRLAVRAGLHPYEVWPEMVDAAITRECAAPDCGQRFPLDGKRRYCTTRCRRRHSMQKLRATPEGAEAARLAARRYYAECGDYVRAERRRRYWKDKEAAA